MRQVVFLILLLVTGEAMAHPKDDRPPRGLLQTLMEPKRDIQDDRVAAALALGQLIANGQIADPKAAWA